MSGVRLPPIEEVYDARFRTPDQAPAGSASPTAVPGPRRTAAGLAVCHDGCGLVATAHGLWECRPNGPAVRHCWQEAELCCARGRLEVRSEPAADPLCAHGMEESSWLPDLVRALDSGSRLVELAFRLPSGTTVMLRARSCRYESTTVWTSRSQTTTDFDAASEDLMTEALLQRAGRSSVRRGAPDAWPG